jgi:hypothetical protein
VLNNVKGIRITRVRKTIHVTQVQADWLEDNAYNVSSLCRKILTKIINKEIDFSTKIKSKPY